MALETMTINELLLRVENEEIALPDIQREFVWTNTQVSDLIDSVYKKHPIGMILLWEVSDKEVPVFSIKGRKREGVRYRYLVIDGQQRLTSLLLAKTGKLQQGRNTKELKLYFNPIREEFQLENPKIKNKADWFRVNEVVGTDSLVSLIDRQRLRQELNLKEEEIYEKVISRLESLKSIFLGDRNSLPVYKLSSSTEYEEVTDIFVKINSKGTRIRITELLLALLSLKLPGRFKKDVSDYIASKEDGGWFLDTAVLIRTLVAISAKQGRLAYFRSIARKISDRSLKNNWRLTKESLDHVIKILEENLGIKSSEIIPSQNSLVLLAFYLFTKNGKLKGEDTKRLILWFLLSNYWGRYVGPTETRLDEDIKSIDETKSLDKAFNNLKNQVGRLYVDKESFVGRDKSKKLLLYVVAREKGAEDWFKGHKITTTDYEEHHIFPRSLLKKRNVDINLIDDIANLAFLTERANRSISNSYPFEYFKTIDNEKLKKQFVPIDKNLWKLNDFKKFIEMRRKKIVSEVNSFLKEEGLDRVI